MYGARWRMDNVKLNSQFPSCWLLGRLKRCWEALGAPGEETHMTDKPPEPDSMPGVIKERKPKGVEGERALERIKRKKPLLKEGEGQDDKEKK